MLLCVLYIWSVPQVLSFSQRAKNGRDVYFDFFSPSFLTSWIHFEIFDSFFLSPEHGSVAIFGEESGRIKRQERQIVPLSTLPRSFVLPPTAHFASGRQTAEFAYQRNRRTQTGRLWYVKYWFYYAKGPGFKRPDIFPRRDRFLRLPRVINFCSD